MESEKVFEAITFAVQAHHGQFRKGTSTPYIVHPISVGRILLESGCPEIVVVAGLLHDTVEDTDVSLEEVQRVFGEGVAELVAVVTEPDKSDTWENRKGHTLESLRSASKEVLLIALADKLDNICSIREAIKWQGDKVWERFRRLKDDQSWYYRGLVELFDRCIKEEPGMTILSEFRLKVEEVF